jgi:NAD(P)H-hydrate epimerase
LDRRAIEEYGIPSLVLMENAGRGVADMLESLGIAGRVVIACGKGNNAGDGFVIARHLDLRGHEVRVLVWADPDELAGDAGVNFRILQKAGVAVTCFGARFEADPVREALAQAAWIVDALLGTGARGDPRPPLDAVIDMLVASAIPIVAVDIPSGLDCDTGVASAHTIRAAHTCTFVAHKPGFLVPGADHYTGEIHVLDIGAPRRLVEEALAAATTVQGDCPGVRGEARENGTIPFGRAEPKTMGG